MKKRPFSAGKADSYPVVVGVDEVGRGCVAGPVVVAAVWFDPGVFDPETLELLDDSKNLTENQRNAIFDAILRGTKTAISASSVEMIESLNIRGATLDAMRRSVLKLGLHPIMVDGIDTIPDIPFPCTAVTKGDQTVPQIAAASIVAKVTRDRLMRRLANKYPHYGWETNVGYASKQHRDAIDKHGITKHHRKSFLQKQLTLL